MNILDNDNYIECTGCVACALICPLNCIEMKYNEEGFLAPIINQLQCINCGKCKTVCIKYIKNSPQVDLFSECQVLAATLYDTEKLKNVSSGGVAPKIEEYGIDHGYEICGVVYDNEKNFCYHTITDNKSELSSFRGSKYLQSNPIKAFNSFEVGKKYCVFGTPCQIYGLDLFLRKTKVRDNYILVDLFCKGVPSRHLWLSYIHYIRNNFGIADIDFINFRNKDISWHKFQMHIRDSAGKTYSRSVYEDLFFQFFIKNICFNSPCYSCEFRHWTSAADIRLGDFWGSKYYSHEEGVSLVILFSELGQNVWDSISDKFWFEQNPSEIVVTSQRFDKYPIYEKRKEVIQKLKDGIPLDIIYESYNMKNINFKIKK